MPNSNLKKFTATFAGKRIQLDFTNPLNLGRLNTALNTIVGECTLAQDQAVNCNHEKGVTCFVKAQCNGEASVLDADKFIVVDIIQSQGIPLSVLIFKGSLQVIGIGYNVGTESCVWFSLCNSSYHFLNQNGANKDSKLNQYEILNNLSELAGFSEDQVIGDINYQTVHKDLLYAIFVASEAARQEVCRLALFDAFMDSQFNFKWDQLSVYMREWKHVCGNHGQGFYNNLNDTFGQRSGSDSDFSKFTDLHNQVCRILGVNMIGPR